jgi:hypothetical protein
MTIDVRRSSVGLDEVGLEFMSKSAGKTSRAEVCATIGVMSQSPAEKMGVAEGARAIILDAPSGLGETLGLPPLDRETVLRGRFAYIHQFATRQADLERALQKLRPRLAPDGMLWVSWPKRGQLDTDLSLQSVIRIGYEHGLVESKTISINSIWSAIKFTHPVPGKTYKNSFGSLKGHRSS